MHYRFLFLLFSFVNISVGYSQLTEFKIAYNQIITESVTNDGVDYTNIDASLLSDASRYLSEINTDLLTTEELIVLYINTYNFTVINEVVQVYPTASVAQIPNFFTSKRALFGSDISLDQLEEKIIETSAMPILHLLLNCGAISCPPLQYVKSLSNIDELVGKALSQDFIYKVDKDGMGLSQIFQWHEKDWASRSALLDDLKLYTSPTQNNALPISYLDYDWMLNESSTNQGTGTGQGTGQNYFPTQLYKKGAGELKIFNNNYTQVEQSFRSNFFSSFIQLLIGTNRNLNVGLDLKLRSVNQGNVGPLSALKFEQRRFGEGGQSGFARVGISGIGPRIKYALKGKGHISLLHTVYFVPMNSAEGNSEYGYSDYNNLQLFNQLFYEKALGPKTRIFMDIGLHIENIKLGVHRNELHTTPIQLPITAIYNYYPSSDWIVYGLVNFAQKIDMRFAPDTNTSTQYTVYGQIGAGVKYYVSDYLELEFLYTNFQDTTPNRTAHTFNLGLRVFRI